MTTVLVAEDNDLNRDVIVRQLERFGFDLIEAENGKEAIDLAKSRKPDAILLDLSMPVMDGWEAAGRLKQDDATADIPVIALTAHAVQGDREKALDAGCDAYRAKPVDMEQLAEFIESTVS